MPALAVSVDGEELATVATAGISMMRLGVHASRWGTDAAILDMSGGNYGDGASRHLTWIDLRPLKPGQVLKVACVADEQTNPAGKTFAELYPHEPPSTRTDFTPTEAMFEELRARPLLYDGYTFRLATSAGMEYTGHTREDEYGFSLSVLWTALNRPECARFSLRSNTLEQLRTRAPARDHVRGDLWLGQSLRFQFAPSASA
jgi:hypothetical protein